MSVRTSGRAFRRVAVAAAGAVLLALALAWVVPLPARLAAPPSVVVEFRDGEPAHVFVAPDGRWRPEVRLREIDPAYLRALLRLEDRRFRWHPGVDPVAVLRAAAGNLAAGRRVSGASTLTMQLVRVLEPRPRTLRSKAIEALRALQLELRLSKDRILAAYLQFVPFGGNVEGVEAASLAFFGHRPTALSAAEIATLLAVPQDPNRRAPAPGHGALLGRARDAVAQRLAALGALPRGGGPAASDGALLAEIAATPVPPALRAFPRAAPHAAAWLRQLAPGEARIRTTLDAGAQRLAERVLQGAAPELRNQGIWNGAAVVVDHAAGEVRALVGNFDFRDGEHGGQVVAFAAPRSPGSTLKPFVYAMAIERGLAGPRTLVADVPAAYGGWSPKNFDGHFDGLVALDDALARSLNVPFVALLREVGVEPFLGALRGMGVRSLDPRPGHYGLSAAIGGVELSPLELAGLYATLARGGTWEELRVRPGPPRPEPARAIAAGAAWLAADALAKRDRPDFPSRRALTGAPAHVRWKTGTSFGHRDAWSAGFGPRHTAVVWLGNVDGTPSRALVGGEVAAPLLFDLLEGLADRAPAPSASVPPPDLVWVEVCALSGRPATPACPHRSAVPALRSAVPTEPCPFHRLVDVDLATGRALAPGCRDGRRFEPRPYVVWPASVRRWLRDADRTLPEPPALADGCARGGRRRAPQIVSPAPGQVALLVPGVDAARQEIPLEADAGEGRLSWFVDGEFLGEAAPEARLWWTPRPGRHELVVTDDAGLSARRALEVRERPR
ncbi:MAG TPA: penicillin-binding protein 1C [Anaeromyxobacteraceae bacterium]|nr:penicillin-binding protein 1C [Anaeromyxobacteraceae bacterium]